MKKNFIVKFLIGLFIVCVLCTTILIWTYLKFLPYAISNQKVINYAQQFIKKEFNVDAVINEPKLVTELSPNIDFKVKEILLTKGEIKLLELKNFHSAFSLAKVFDKIVKINNLTAEQIYVDVNGIENIIPKRDKPKQKSEWNIDIYDALLGVRNCEFIYYIQPDTKIWVKGEHIGVNNAEKIKRNVYFQLFAEITRDEHIAKIEIKDSKKVYFKDNILHADNCPIKLNNSNVLINLLAYRDRTFDLEVFSKSFNLNDIIDFLNTQIIENNVNDTLAYFDDISGNLNFSIKLSKDDISGDFILNRLKFKIKNVDNVPVTLTKGNIKLTKDRVVLDGFEGFYDSNSENKISFKGTVKDYLKSIDTDIEGNAIARNDFFKNHLSNMIGSSVALNGNAKTKVMFKSKNNIMDIVWLFMLKPGENIIVGDEPLPFEESLRVMASKMHLENMVLDINSMDYYIAPKGQKLEKPKKNAKRPDPIFSLSSKIDIAHDNYVSFLSFEIPNPLPSEILNVVLKQNLFKRGKIGGKLTIENSGKYPVLNGKMVMDRVLIPSQRTFIKEAALDAKGSDVSISAKGGYKRSKFDFNANILNELKYPIVVKDTNLTLESLDVYKLLNDSATDNSNTDNSTIVTDSGSVKVEDAGSGFDIKNLIIEKCKLHLGEGTYKEIKFANLDADLTLDENSQLEVKSNRFDFAGGESSLRVNCDFKNKQYGVKLGVLNVDSDIIAKALLDLEREITGKASGFISINTDDTLKLNGSIKFKIENGTIEKIGLVEYILKFAALFRNPLTMISPAIFSDVINIPEGKFDKITGSLELKNNVVNRIKIKSYSPQLSTYIAGRYDLENKDASLRIYTRFSSSKKGFAGFIRNISLNALANRIPLSSRNDANYYAVELEELPQIDVDEKDSQIFLTKVEGDVEHNNYISSLKKIK